MDYTDYLLWKLGALTVAAFFWGMYREFTRPKREQQERAQRDRSARS